MSKYRGASKKKKNPMMADDVMDIARLYKIPYEITADGPGSCSGGIRFVYRNDSDRHLIEAAINRVLKRQAAKAAKENPA